IQVSIFVGNGVVKNVEFLGIAPGKHGGAARHANRTLNMALVKCRAALRQEIDIWSLRPLRTETAQGIGTMLVGHDPEDVRPALRIPSRLCSSHPAACRQGSLAPEIIASREFLHGGRQPDGWSTI